MKNAIRSIIRKFGIDIVRYNLPKAEGAEKSIRTDAIALYSTATGDYFLPVDAVKDVVVMAIRENRIFESEIVDVAKEYIKENTIVLDIGSNFGQMAILMSKLVGDNGVVHAFEANDFVFKALEKNIYQNSAKIIAHFGAVHDQSGETLYFTEHNFEKFDSYGSYGIDYIHGQGKPVKTIAIDALKLENPISFMKIDVQGGDLHVLRGAVETIKRHKMPIIFEYEFLLEVDLGLRFQDYIDFVQSIDYYFARVINGQNYLILPKETSKNTAI